MKATVPVSVTCLNNKCQWNMELLHGYCGWLHIFQRNKNDDTILGTPNSHFLVSCQVVAAVYPLLFPHWDLGCIMDPLLWTLDHFNCIGKQKNRFHHTKLLIYQGFFKVWELKIPLRSVLELHKLSELIRRTWST